MNSTLALIINVPILFLLYVLTYFTQALSGKRQFYGISLNYDYFNKKEFKVLDKKYKQNPISDNKILTQNVKIGLDGKKHRRNLNVLICGGSGAGKTRFYAKPNIMQCNCSFVCLDPKRRTFKRYRKSFREKRVWNKSFRLNKYGKKSLL